jgi:hypothetical protein
MLVDKKASLSHGEFQLWIQKNCEFEYNTAARYMKAAQSSKAVNLSALSHIFPSGKPREKSKPKSDLDSVQISTAVDFCEKTAAEKAPFLPQPEPPEATAEGPKSGPIKTTVGLPAQPVSQPSATELSEPECPEWDADEDAALEAASLELIASAERAMGSDAMTEIKRLTSELAAVKLSRDGYMDGKSEITRLLQAEQRKCDRLTKRVADLEKDNKQLRERISAMENAA